MRKHKGVCTVRKRAFAKMDYIVVSICLLGMILGGVGLWFGNLDYKRATEEYESLGKYVQLTVSDTSERSSTSEVNLETTDQLFNIDWNALRKINPDIVGWIVIPDTAINYPIVQTMDNSTYLHQSFEGNKNACGTIFMNTYNHADYTDWNTVIYGHNMKNGSMFATLNKYKDEDFYKEHDEVWVLTPYWERKYQIISAHEAQDGSETYAIEFGDGQYEAHVASEVTQSNYDTGNGYDVEMPMITLSTCTGRGTLSRFVLVCQPVYETLLNPFIADQGTVSENNMSN